MNVASGACRRVASSRLSVPFALTPKSVCGSGAAQSCEGCAAVWMTSSIVRSRANSASIRVGVADVEVERAERVAEARARAAAVVWAVEASGPKKRARMSFSIPITR